MTRHPWQRQRNLPRIDPLIDQALQDPSENRWRALVEAAGPRPAHCAERVRHRAAKQARSPHVRQETLLQRRDRLFLVLYAAEAPEQFTAWTDATLLPDQQRAGIGGVLCSPGGYPLAEFSAPVAAGDAVEAEIAAVVNAVLLAGTGEIGRLRVHTDCTALLQLWREQRSDPRLQELVAAAQSLHLEIRAVPRLHNQRADWLARHSSVR